MLKSSRWIREQAEQQRLIEPFVAASVRQGVVSYGLGPYGYDLRLARVFKRPRAEIVRLDPFTLTASDFVEEEADAIVIEPGNFILGRSVEYFRLPKKVLGLVFGKSTYARCGIVVNVTPLEPEWSGYLTISLANAAAKPAVLHPDQGIAQVIFIESDEWPLFSYRDLQGKYNDQAEIAVSRIQKD